MALTTSAVMTVVDPREAAAEWSVRGGVVGVVVKEGLEDFTAGSGVRGGLGISGGTMGGQEGGAVVWSCG